MSRDGRYKYMVCYIYLNALGRLASGVQKVNGIYVRNDLVAYWCYLKIKSYSIFFS